MCDVLICIFLSIQSKCTHLSFFFGQYKKPNSFWRLCEKGYTFSLEVDTHLLLKEKCVKKILHIIQAEPCLVSKKYCMWSEFQRVKTEKQNCCHLHSITLYQSHKNCILLCLFVWNKRFTQKKHHSQILVRPQGKKLT